LFITRTLQTENPFDITSSCHSHKVFHLFKTGSWQITKKLSHSMEHWP